MEGNLNSTNKEALEIKDDIVIGNKIETKTIIIPQNVVKIAPQALANSRVEKIIFEGTNVKSIEEYAFKNCSNIEFIDLPENLIQISSKAFYNCTSLSGIYIPKSVLNIEDNAFEGCNSNFCVVGCKNSLAEQFCKKNNIVFYTNKEEVKSIVEKANNNRKNLQTVSFDIFGETITCSNSLPLYDEVIGYYKNTNDFVQAIWNCLPKKFNSTTDFVKQFENVAYKLPELCSHQNSKTILRLYHNGVFISNNDLDKHMAVYQNHIYQIVLALVKYMTTLIKNMGENIKSKEIDLKYEIESQVTGLSYGVIGDRFDVLVHSIDDSIQQSYQRGRATAIAEIEMQNYVNAQNKNIANLYIEALNTISDGITKSARNYIVALCQFEIEALEKSSLLRMDDTKELDYEKSCELYNKAISTDINNEYVLALAIKKYPYNIEAIMKAKSKGYCSQGLEELIDFLDIRKTIYDQSKTILKYARDKNDYRKAKRLFENIREYQDSEKLIETINAKLDEIEITRKNDIYDKALRRLGRSSSHDVKEAISLFESISGWRDADEKIQKCKIKYDELIKAEENARIQRQKQEELERIKEIKRKRIKIISIVISCILLVAFIFCSYFVIYPYTLKTSNDFDKYITYIERFKVDNFEIPEGITEIPEGAFENCYQLQLRSITFPSTLQTIGENAFKNCGYLKSVTFSNSITYVGDYAFSGCDDLTTVNISDLKAWCEINFEGFGANPLWEEDQAMLYLNGIKVVDLVVPHGTTKIGSYAFASYDGLKSVIIPNTVKSVGRCAFNHSGLTKVIVDSEKIDRAAFKDCQSLKTVTMGNNVTNIGEDAFWGCESLTSIEIPNSVTSIGTGAFGCCESLTSVVIGNSVTSIGLSAFYKCSSLTSIEIPDSVESIGRSAFYGCSSLTSINFEGTVKQWNSIDKEFEWDGVTAEYTIYCTDGEIAKDGTVTYD